MDNEIITTVIEKTLDERDKRDKYDRRQHERHHDWLEEEIKQRSIRDARRRRISDFLIGTVFVSALGSFLTGIGWLVKTGISHILEHLKQ